MQNKYELNRRIQEWSARKVPKLIFFLSGSIVVWSQVGRNIIKCNADLSMGTENITEEK